MVIKNAYEIGQIVFLVTDNDQRRRVVTQIKVTATGIMYNLSCGTYNSDHYDCEITPKEDVLAKLN